MLFTHDLRIEFINEDPACYTNTNKILPDTKLRKATDFVEESLAPAERSGRC